jgi:NAD(P)-dependent dehydrogenase (short-subunit alcohol dehydrogenase family)
MSTDSRTLLGRRALVTGAGSGIGRGIAVALAQQGAFVALAGRRAAPLEQSASLIREAGGRAFVSTLDVTDKASVARGAEAVLRELGGLDILVNNAGAGGPNGCLAEGPDRWDEIVRTNLDGMFFVTREALKHFADGGRVVNVSSVLGKFGVPGYTAYCASKHGVIGFTKALALEAAPRQITVNAICPGWVETEMAKQGMELIAEGTGVSYAEARAQALALVPLGRILQPAEIGGLVAWLCSPAASGVTGQAWSICGGSTMG